MVQTVTTQHPNFFTLVTRDQLQQEMTNLLDSVPQKSDAEVVLGMQRLLALGGDGHTNLSPFQGGSPVRRFAFRLYWFSDGIFVTDAAAAYASVLGRQLVRIENTPVDEAVSRIAPLISHENNWWVRSQAATLLVSPDVLTSVGIAPKGAASISFTFQDANGLPQTLAIAPGSAALYSLPQKARPNPPLYRRNPERYYWYDFLDAAKLLYIKYNVCQESPVLSMNDFVNDLFAAYQTTPINLAVIDVRNNGGGDSRIINPLEQALTQANAEGAVSMNQVFVVIGRDTFSSGMFAAIDLKRLGATLIGEPTGNRPNSFGNVVPFTVPNSRLTGQVSTRQFQFPDFPGDALMPDIPVELSSADYFAERDPVLDAILK